MIYVTLYQHDHQTVGYEFVGHADSAPYGEDIVCAAASTLAIVTENGLSVQGVAYEAEMDEGYVKLILHEQEDERHAIIAEAVLKTLETGVLEMAKNYSQFITANKVFV